MIELSFYKQEEFPGVFLKKKNGFIRPLAETTSWSPRPASVSRWKRSKVVPRVLALPPSGIGQGHSLGRARD